MTEAISDDTAVASAVASLFLHLLTHDYAFLNDRTARLGGTVSHGAAMFASALISSRLENLDAVFADALLAAVLFILFPFARRTSASSPEPTRTSPSRSPRTSPRSRRYGRSPPRAGGRSSWGGTSSPRSPSHSPRPSRSSAPCDSKGKSTDHGTRPRSPPNNNKGSLVLFCTAPTRRVSRSTRGATSEASQRASGTQQMRDSVLSHSYF